MQHILFPVDFSEQCDAAAPAVAALARKFGSQVSLMHVLALPRLRSEMADYTHHFKTILEEMEGGLRDYQSALWKGLTVDHVFRTGNPVHELVEFARYQRVSLIMMPTRGFTRFRQLLLGSVTAGVLHDCECPVWTNAHIEDAPAVQPYKSILCAVELNPAAIPVLRISAQFAAAYGASLHVMHALTTSAREEEAVVRLGELAGEAGIPSKTELDVVPSGTVTDAVAASSERHRADLLIIGRGRIQGTLGRLRTNAHNLIRLSRCPVLSV